MLQSPRITEAASNLLGGEGRHGMHALVHWAITRVWYQEQYYLW